MEREENLLEVIYEKDEVEEDDVDMIDVEGEFVDQDLKGISEKSNDTHPNVLNKESLSKNRRRRSNKKKNKKTNCGVGTNVTDINRFVLDSCRRLKEKKSYMVYTAVGCLGISVLSDLIKEVDAIQACGGQMTADGRRSRTGGGVLWNIIKAREPKTYKEIMQKAKDFEKIFRQPNGRQSTRNEMEDPKEVPPHVFSDQAPAVAEASPLTALANQQHKQSDSEEKRPPVHERLRVPLSYDDSLLEEDLKDGANPL